MATCGLWRGVYAFHAAGDESLTRLCASLSRGNCGSFITWRTSCFGHKTTYLYNTSVTLTQTCVCFWSSGQSSRSSFLCIRTAAHQAHILIMVAKILKVWLRSMLSVLLAFASLRTIMFCTVSGSRHVVSVLYLYLDF